MHVTNPLQPINIFSNMLNIAQMEVLNHILLSLIKSIDEYKENLLKIESLVTLNPTFRKCLKMEIMMSLCEP